MMKRLIKAQSPQLGNLIPNEAQFSAIKDAGNNIFDEEKLYKIVGNQGCYGCISYKSVKNPNEKIDLYATEIYVSLKAAKDKRSIMFITRPLLPNNTFGNPVEVRQVLSESMEPVQTFERDSTIQVNGTTLIKLSSKNYDTAIKEVEDLISEQFKNVSFS